jgi:hypothetical protein
MAHAAKVAFTSNPAVVGHWRTECFNLHLALSEEYQKSMRRRIDLDKAWRKSKQKVRLSFADHGEPAPDLPDGCPFTLEELVDVELDIELLVAKFTPDTKKAG